jgi:hypothetical protein
MSDFDPSDPSTAFPINRINALYSSQHQPAVIDAIETVPDANGRQRAARISFNENGGDAELAFFAERFKNFPALETLVLRGPKVTDAGLVHLRSLKQLKYLILIDTLVTERGKAVLLRALPNLHLEP